MKRFHVQPGAPDLAASIRFYPDRFGMAPSVRKPDYAKGMLEDPRFNFAISRHGAGRTGPDYLGLQAESADKLAGMRERFTAADCAGVVDENDVACRCARSDKHWVRDPQGIAREALHSLGSVPFHAEGHAPTEAASACGTTVVPGAKAPCG